MTDAIEFFIYMIGTLFNFLGSYTFSLLGFSVSFLSIFVGFYVIMFFVTHFWRSKVQ